MHNEKNVKILCRYLGGSHLYGLNTPSSDEDIRGVFQNTDPSHILGLKRFDEERKLDSEEDKVLRELSHFMRLLQRGNTEAFECLFAHESVFIEMDKDFKFLRNFATDLIDSERFYNSLRGYAQGEYRLALGQRQGVIGSKRCEALKQYGFSPKNATNLFRLLYTGIFFFNEGKYIVNCREFGEDIFNQLYNIKTNPRSYSVTQMERDYKDLEARFDEAFKNRPFTHKFNEVTANWILLQLYFPHLKDYYENR